MAFVTIFVFSSSVFFMVTSDNNKPYFGKIDNRKCRPHVTDTFIPLLKDLLAHPRWIYDFGEGSEEKKTFMHSLSHLRLALPFTVVRYYPFWIMFSRFC